jgi:hypothetical protein
VNSLSSLYPEYKDIFTIKKDETGTGDGDYVMAEHVNDLQDSVVAIEEVLGTNPQGNALTVKDRIQSIEDNAKVFRLPAICIYNGDPALVNSLSTTSEAADLYTYFKYVVLAQGIEDELSELHSKTIELIGKAPNVNFCGTVDMTESLNTVKSKAYAWINMGAKGVYLKNFGFEHGVDRTKQNAVLDYIHERNTFALYDSADPDNILTSNYSDGMNPNYVDLNTTSKDIYIHFGFDSGNPLAVANKLAAYRATYGIKLCGISNLGNYNYAHALATILSYDIFFQQPDTYSSNNILTLNRVVPIFGNFYASVPNTVDTNGILERYTPNGKLLVNTNDSTFEFADVKIPDYMVDVQEVSWDDLTPGVITAINSPLSAGFINPSKIGTFEASDFNKITAAVIEAVNVNANYIDAMMIEAKIVEALAITSKTVNSEVVNAGIARVLDLVAQNAELYRISANLINAVNANLTNAKINSAQIGELTASHIQAQVIEAIRIAVGNVIGDTAAFKQMVADVITGQLINAANVRITSSASGTGEILVIDQGGLTAASAAKVNPTDTYWPADAKVIKLNKNGLAISSDGGHIWTTKLTGSGLSVITADIGDAQITNAKIDSVSANKLTAGTIDANVITVTNLNASNVTSGTLNGIGMTIGSGETVFKASANGIQLGSATFANAPFSVDMQGHLKATVGDVGGILIDSQGLVLNTGSIVDTRTASEQKLHISKDGVIAGNINATSGTINGIQITPAGIQAFTAPAAPDIITNITNITNNTQVTDNEYITNNYYLQPDSIRVRGSESVIIDTGTLVVKDDNSVNRITLGNLADGTYGLYFDFLTGKYLKLNKDGFVINNGTINTINVTSAGNVTITGTINATAGTLQNLSVTGNITAGDVTISTTGISGTGYSLSSSGVTATKGTIGGWTIDTSSIRNADSSFILDSANGALKLATSKIVLNKDGSATIGKLSIASTGAITSDNFSITSAGVLSLTGTVNATGGYFGNATNGVTVGATGLAIAGTGSITGTGFTLSNNGLALTKGSINLGSGLFQVSNAGVLTATSGTIGGVTIGSSSLTAGVVTLSSTGINVATTVPITIGTTGIQSTNFKLNADGTVQITGALTATSGTFTGTIQSNSGYFGTTTNGVSIGASGLAVVGTGTITAGGSTITNTGIQLRNGSDIIMLDGSNNTIFSANSTGINAVAGNIGGWSLTNSTIQSASQNVVIDSSTPVIRIKTVLLT